ncbi:hypothetical protein Tco_0739349 [Tanacetum coccineum]
MGLKLVYNTLKHTEGETLSQTFTHYKILMNELVDDGVTLSNHEISYGSINSLPKKWLKFNQSLKNSNHVRNIYLTTLFEKYKYEEKIFDKICALDTKKAITSPISTTFFSNSVVQDFQDKPSDEEDMRISKDYLDDLNE